MRYKYKKGQIFGKRLKVPKDILSNVYKCILSFKDFVEYELEDKIPIDCLIESDRKIVEKFGIEKAKTLDWELINKQIYYNMSINFRNLLMSIDSQTEDINSALYELVKDQIKPIDYSSKMREVYSDRFIDVSQNNDENLRYIMNAFNEGAVGLKEIIYDWDLFKDKDLSYCLLNDVHNELGITTSQVREFMNEFSTIARLMLDDNTNMYQVIHEINGFKNESERKEYIKKITDSILEKTISKNSYQLVIELSNNEYRALFKYSIMEDYLKLFNDWATETLIEELKTLPQDYVFNIPIPFRELLNFNVLSFIGTYGLKNIVDFDNECGHFFTNNNCEMLKLMYEMYLQYSGNQHDPNKTIHTKNDIDENGHYIDRPYTKDEFYEAMRRMIIYGPSNGDFIDKAPDYREMVGEFRVRNAELFISEQAPEELQKLFYTKSITPQVLIEKPEYIEYLTGKDLSSCFKGRGIQVEGSNGNYVNLYKFLGSKIDFDGVINFITEYCDVLDIIFDKGVATSYQYEIKFSRQDNISEIQRKINETLRKLIIEKGIPYPKNIPQNFKANYPSMFLSEDAPQKLQEAFYSRTIDSRFIVSNPNYRNYLKNVDLDLFYMPVYIIKASNGLYSYENLYKFLGSKTDFDGVINFITEYCDVLDIIFDGGFATSYQYGIKFSRQDNISEIQRRINETLRKLIIEKGIPYPKNIPQSLKANYPSMFLSEDAPQKLQEAFYSRTIDSSFIISNPVYRNYLKNVDLELIYKYMPVPIIGENDEENLVHIIQQVFGIENSFDIMFIYGKYIEAALKINKLSNLKFNPNSSKDDLLDKIDANILQAIINGGMKYDENIPSHFKNNNPTLFLSPNVPEDIRKKFYNKELTLDDFTSNPNLLDIFSNTNIVCGFSKSISWMIPLLDDSDNPKTTNFNRLKIISAYSKIQDYVFKNTFKKYVMELGNSINVEKIEYVAEVLSRLSLSNSSEIYTFRMVLTPQLLKLDNPIESLNNIEDIFIRNNIPTVGKIYSCFEILHPNFEGFDFTIVSPVLKKASTMSKKIITFSDLIKASFASNNRSVNDYLKNIEIGSKLYESIKIGQIQYESLDEDQKNELTIFSRHLITLYNNTLTGKKENERFTSTEDVLADILELSKKLSPNGTLDYNLADRVIRMFCGFTGINTLEQAKSYINQKIKMADTRNRKASSTEMILEQGDFIKGIGDITYLRNILQNGSVSKEYLGSSAGSDSTPLDTDVSMVTESSGTTKDKFNKTAIEGYGPIWFVLKNDDRFITTRTSSETLNVKNDLSKMEVFYTGVLGLGHYGIRTGFASSEINYIVMGTYDPRVGLEIAMNGFYIPIANTEGQIVFTPDDYDNLRKKMSGLSYYDENNYTLSENLVTEETEYLAEQIEQSNHEVQAKRAKINDVIKKSLDEIGLHLKTYIDGDLTEGFVELIDTGSTGRGTNKPGDGDFDFIMRLDNAILSDALKLKELKQTLLRNLGKENSHELTIDGDFRLKKVQIDDINVDIDITFTKKTDKVSYSTDMALQDRLSTIRKNNPEKYKYVVANIILAKQVLKKAEVYKPNRGENPQGGLGGVGIENWILQNGGSFIDAAKSFVETSEGKSFEEFKANYQIWDFGDNFLAERQGHYPHDNFVANNMSEAGYHKMVQVLKEYMKNHTFNPAEEIGQTDTIKR